MQLVSFFDRILFRIVPGLCFLWQIILIYNELDTRLRPAGGIMLHGLVFIFILTLATQVVWVVAGEEVFLQRTRKQEATEMLPTPAQKKKKFLAHLLGFVLNGISLFFVSPPESWWQFLVLSGAVYTAGTFIAELLLVLPGILRSGVQALKNCSWRTLWFQTFLVVLMLGIYFPPVFYLLFQIAKNFSTPWGMGGAILFVCLSRWKTWK